MSNKVNLDPLLNRLVNNTLLINMLNDKIVADVNPQARGHWVDHAWLLNGQSWEALVMHGLGAL